MGRWLPWWGPVQHSVAQAPARVVGTYDKPLFSECSGCVERDAEIERLRARLAELVERAVNPPVAVEVPEWAGRMRDAEARMVRPPLVEPKMAITLEEWARVYAGWSLSAPWGTPGQEMG